MNYTLEIIDAWGRRRATLHEAPLLRVSRGATNEPATITGILPEEAGEIGPGCQLRVHIDGKLFCVAEVQATTPQWSDARKLILDTYVPFHEVLGIQASTSPARLNRRVSRAYTNRDITAIVRDVVNAALGPLHYWVDHTAYPEGANREHAKFLARKTTDNELEVGGISAGQWVGSDRIDASAAYAKDGDTISGLVVDGAAWPDLRLLMIDCEESGRNSHAFKRHPETAFWSNDEYNRSIYKQRADAATANLQHLLDTHGIDFVELNPHRDATGAYDDRVDAYGRYIALIYGGGQCFNAAQVEQGHADVYLYNDGRYHDPEMALKDYYSYQGVHRASLHAAPALLQEFDITAGALEILTALAYAAGGYTFHIDAEDGLHFCPAAAPNRVVYFDPHRMSVHFGRNTTDLGNIIYLKGNPYLGALNETYTRGESIGEYGPATRRFEFYSLTTTADAARLAAGMLDDLAYPAVTGYIEFLDGNAELAPGDLIELRGAPLRRIERELPGEYGGRFSGKLVARATRVEHRLAGRHLQTRVYLGPPLRSVDNPLSYIVRSQPGASTLFEFRLDAPAVGLDLGFHLD